jgi:hypothetical protein
MASLSALAMLSPTDKWLIVAIPTDPNGGNHTASFTASAGTPEAHEASLVVTKALAHTGFRVINDNDFYEKVNKCLCQKVCGFWLINCTSTSGETLLR